MQTPPGDNLRPSPSFFCMILSLCEVFASHHSNVQPAGSNAEPSSLVNATNTVFASPTCKLKFWLRTVMRRCLSFVQRPTVQPVHAARCGGRDTSAAVLASF